MVLCTAGAFARSDTLSDEGDGVELLRTGSRAPYVHRITLYDHDGTAIDPTDDFAGPYSPRATCGKCHPYAQISHGWHFNAWRAEISAGRPGEPWFLVDPNTGAQTMISGRRWPGTHAPADVGLTHWQFVKRFGRHLPGGGYGEPPDDVVENSDKALRWGISGKLEIDCMFCHSADQQHDPAEAARQIEAENFKWAPTAALGLAVVRGEARKAPDDWDPLMPPDPDFPERAGPRLIWDQTRFDPDDRVLFNIAERPSADRCYFCHSFREVGGVGGSELLESRDVHLAAGMTCVDCHRNDLDHMIVRGYRTEAAERAAPHLFAFTCEGCHLGAPDANDQQIADGGRYGAPRPQHRGLPPLHFEKLTCTACHSGPWPGFFPWRYQTALAHTLGLASRDRSDDAPPYITGPVLARQPDGRIAPQRITWAELPSLLRPDDPQPQPAQHEDQGPYRWSLAHDVRPATQSLGVHDCTDCHANGAPILYGKILASVPGGRRGIAQTPNMLQLRQDNARLAGAWNTGFFFRPAFKWFAFACLAVLGLLLGHAAMSGIGAAPWTRVATAAPAAAAPRDLTRFEHVVHAVAVVGILIQLMTGFVLRWIFGELSGWLLFVHMIGAPIFILGLTGTALLWARGCGFGPTSAGDGGLNIGQKVMFWVTLVLGFVTMAAMLVATLPAFGTQGQLMLVEIHETAALLLLIALAVHTVVSLAARQARRAKR